MTDTKKLPDEGLSTSRVDSCGILVHNCQSQLKRSCVRLSSNDREPDMRLKECHVKQMQSVMILAHWDGKKLLSRRDEQKEIAISYSMMLLDKLH